MHCEAMPRLRLLCAFPKILTWVCEGYGFPDERLHARIPPVVMQAVTQRNRDPAQVPGSMWRVAPSSKTAAWCSRRLDTAEITARQQSCGRSTRVGPSGLRMDGPQVFL